jgi:uncharacterized protein with FMN-binding domain
MNLARKLAVCVACAAMAAAVVSCARSSGGPWKDGTYEGRAEGVHGEINLTVTVEKGKIARIDVTKQQEAAGVSDAAFAEVPRKIIEKQSTTVDAVSGASMTSKAIMAAAQDALAKAVKQ